MAETRIMRPAIVVVNNAFRPRRQTKGVAPGLYKSKAGTACVVWGCVEEIMVKSKKLTAEDRHGVRFGTKRFARRLDSEMASARLGVPRQIVRLRT